MPLATVRSRIAELRATGAVVMRKLTRYDGDRTIVIVGVGVPRVGVCAEAGAGTEGEEGGVVHQAARD